MFPQRMIFWGCGRSVRRRAVRVSWTAHALSRHGRGDHTVESGFMVKVSGGESDDERPIEQWSTSAQVMSVLKASIGKQYKRKQKVRRSTLRVMSSLERHCRLKHHATSYGAYTCWW
ncbi:hypothetical protein HRR83_007088 [Exophiala dermatitidis]|uniref:Uncharacterized protein n=1 Tax=Exophiala dermatitidis TaxID=5970 RepID=A0AAN6IT24_EXODE|nr:hypothetical protein HRR73_006380 [Exophiala dermatitidis]KAJ4512016.1 hypothetical protein HRR74_006752 [Exophiala dermatitidis]KAJ4534882.1 hypothetical protein HRR76_006788 [Exophiala dermatitidis]KAJ4550770.1 hypothetical protein HRR77_003129 [Exophiala dermatitidis]KAJ4562105.1 hypothetical protein HRR79_006966 [Exophiala dermatitidis]